jgi:hypothetical protein
MYRIAVQAVLPACGARTQGLAPGDLEGAGPVTGQAAQQILTNVAVRL